MRQALYLKLREPVPAEQVQSRPELVAARTTAGRLDVGRKDERFWPVVGLVLDVLEGVEARVSEAAERLGISTGNLIAFLETEPKVWEVANQLRTHFGHKPLRGS